MFQNNQSHFHLGFKSPFEYRETQKISTLPASKNNNRKCLLLVILFVCILSLAIGVILAMVLKEQPAATPTALDTEVNTNGLTILLTIDPANNTDAVNEILNNPELLIPGLAQTAGINANVITEMTTVMGIEMTLETTYQDAAQLVQPKFKEWLEKSVNKKIVEELNVSPSRIITSIEKKESRIINIIVKIFGTKPNEPSYEESATALTTLVENGVLNLPGYTDFYSTRIKRDTNKWKVIQRIKVMFLFIDVDLLHFEDLVKALSLQIKDKTMTLGVESPKMSVLALSFGSITITGVKALKGCHLDRCLNQGVCLNAVDVFYKCICKDGYTENNCETDIDECASSPCQNGGTCNDQTNGYICTCLEGWNGTQCDNNIDECASLPCMNGGTCTDHVNQYTCTCMDGWNGRQCENNINECASSPCMHDGTCNDHVNKYTCTCMNGWQGRNCDIDINECASVPCMHGGTCADHVGQYICTCMNGWTGRNCETNIHECASTPCLNDGTCNDMVDSYHCTCAPGWEGDHCQNNIDECTSYPCQNGATCNDLINGYNCTCAPGWEGVLCENNTNECASTPCLNGGTCHDMIDAYNCTCAPGWEGDNCQNNTDECASNPCQNGATCNDFINEYNCTCAPGWEGILCENNTYECASTPCLNDGTCNDMVDAYNCTCAPGWEGDHCQNNTDECASSPCQNDGTCNDQINGYNCTCAPGWVEDHCQNNTDECASTPCQNNGTCNDQVNGYNCTCEPGWEADHCQNDTDECASSPCQNNGTCSDMVNGFNCTCEPGWEGDFCEINIDECASNPCEYDGTCNDMTNGYNCTCTLGPSGDDCEITPDVGTLLATCDSGFTKLRDVTEDNTGHLLVSGLRGGLRKCSLTGGHTSAEAITLPSTMYSAVQPSSGDLWVTLNSGDGATLYKMSDNDPWQAINNLEFYPRRLRLDQDENLIIINDGRKNESNYNILKLNITSELIMDTIISDDRSIAAFPLNATSILVSFRNKHCAKVLHWDGSPPTTTYGTCGRKSGSQVKSPKGVTVDTQGRVIIVNSDNDQLIVYHNDGSFWGYFPAEQLTDPRSVLITQKNLLVVGEEESGMVKTFWMGQGDIIGILMR